MGCWGSPKYRRMSRLLDPGVLHRSNIDLDPSSRRGFEEATTKPSMLVLVIRFMGARSRTRKSLGEEDR
jgi:hypothetical protein